ncbi:MAG: hypothetical protein GY903_03890 [Fuerstiella sp.]|nr:hypothetical protein [Fuerstiella sp.]MCP4853616.1 hypothetical protein [Fuerstiella sp.]
MPHFQGQLVTSPIQGPPVDLQQYRIHHQAAREIVQTSCFTGDRIRVTRSDLLTSCGGQDHGRPVRFKPAGFAETRPYTAPI